MDFEREALRLLHGARSRSPRRGGGRPPRQAVATPAAAAADDAATPAAAAADDTPAAAAADDAAKRSGRRQVRIKQLVDHKREVTKKNLGTVKSLVLLVGGSQWH